MLCTFLSFFFKEIDFGAGDYDVKYVEGEEKAEIIATCEKHGGKGRAIVHLGPKDETSQPSSMQYLNGKPQTLICFTDDIHSVIRKEGRKEMFYLTTHSTHFIYGYIASDI